ncbi:MAG TPA: hypothetical protein VFC41_09920 [Anaerovoracaceae bacterium]|nr:hypothetical protein [Anaerovoracaceae bacterium]
MKEHSAPDEIAVMQLTHPTCLLKKASKGHFKRETAIQLRELAKTSVGKRNKTLSIQISLSISQIELYDEQLSKIEKSLQLLSFQHC